MTQEEKAKRYDELLLKLQKAKVDDNVCDEMYYRVIDDIVPELKESEDEKMRKDIIRVFKGELNYTSKEDANKYIAWLEKQGEQKQETNYPKFDFDDILAIQCCMETADKVTEDKELYEKLKSLHNRLYDAYWLGKQSDKPQGKSAVKNIKEEKVDNVNKVEPKDYSSIDPHFGKPISEDLEKAAEEYAYTNWQSDDYHDGAAEGLPFDAIGHTQKTFKAGAKWQAAQKHTWSKEDEYRTEKLLGWLNTLINYIQGDATVSLDLYRERKQQVEIIKTWLKSLKALNTWKPSEAQMIVLNEMITDGHLSNANEKILKGLQEQLEKLK